MREFVNRIEPFAVGYLEAECEHAEYRIACGMLERAKYIPISIDPKKMFAGYYDKNEEGVRYTFGRGIAVEDAILDRKVAAYPQYRDELEFIRSAMKKADTERIFFHTISDLAHKQMEQWLCHGGDFGGHANPEFMFHDGTNGLKEKIARYRKLNPGKETFYDALMITVEALEVLAERYCELAMSMAENAVGETKKRLERIVQAFFRVPQHAPRDFFEACQMFWLIFSFDDRDSPGRFDRSMISYYRMSEEKDRLECLEAIWELFHETRTWNLCVGGSDEQWNDQSNELTYDILRTAKKYGYHTPNLTMRVHRNTPEPLFRLAAETIATGIGMPVLYNDECVCPALEALEIPPSDSHNYCMNGCNQIDIFGKSHMGLEDGEVCLAKCLQLALNRGVCSVSGETLGIDTGNPEQFTSYEALWNAYIKQVEAATDAAVNMANISQEIYAQMGPNPLRSNLIQGCIEKGLDYKNKGPVYGHGQILAEGIADTVDSLAAMKYFIYDTKRYTMNQLLEALKCDFEGYEALYRDFSSYQKFGNDEEEINAIYKEVIEHFYRYLLTKETFRGGIYGGGCSPFNRAAMFGEKVGALPNGKRKNSALLADSIGSVPGNDYKGPTALLNSVLSMDQTLAKSGNVLNLKFQKEMFASQTGMEAFLALAKAYFASGGQQLSVSVVSAEELLDARIHPERHKNLIVRVGGYSDYFTNLSPELQDNIIQRTLLMA